MSKNPRYSEVEKDATLTALLENQGANRSSEFAQSVRDNYKHYFNTSGAVDFQNKCLE